MDVDTELSSSDANAGRKRPLVGLALFDSGSDTETEIRSVAKRYSASRGKLTSKGRGTGLARAKAELKAKAAEAREEAFERSLRSRAFRKETAVIALDSEESSSSEVRRELKESASSLQSIVDALASRTEAEETRRLRADNGRLRKEVDSLKAELKAHRREFAEMRTTVAVANEASTSTVRDTQALEEFKASIMSSVGFMIKAQMEGIQDRLLPAKVLRPPLAADKKQAVVQKTAPTYAQVVHPTPPPKPAQVPKRVPAVESVPLAPTTCPSATPTTSESQPREAQKTSWSTVVKKGRKKKKASPSATASATIPSTVAKAPPVAKPRLVAPRRAAVMVTLQPDAQEKGVTYAHILERVEQGVKLQDIGICGGLRVRRSATGARLLELPKAQAEQADKLAEKLRTVLDGVASVVRPVKRVDLKVTGLDDSVTKDKLVAAVARAGNCSPDSVRCGVLQRGPGYMGIVRVTCPLTAAKKISDAGRLLVGWSSAKVCVLEQRPLRCFKCMGFGHTKVLCPYKTERGGLCFRCGVDGHKSAGCTEKLRCAVCADAGKPSGHVMGSGECNPPITKGTVVLGTQTTTNVGRRQAEEEASIST
ncbi:uncharacterized protein LOC126770398 [Nymphalis io]|uniref:uncharacterized protein LOC126770398 n=1 Tax=Inachis io TaxID=171585 RepID=UPI0021676F53|nr:uncharacterized protein LOC126770398 [Nymphalis io]